MINLIYRIGRHRTVTGRNPLPGNGSAYPSTPPITGSTTPVM